MKTIFKMLFFAVLITGGIIYVIEPRWESAVAEYNQS